jgi:hypothetical protein
MHIAAQHRQHRVGSFNAQTAAGKEIILDVGDKQGIAALEPPSVS